VNGIQRAAYRQIPSFRREAGGLYAAYVAVYSRLYAARMAWLHKRGRHQAPFPDSVAPRCSWCGAGLTGA
jgi:hypothetical protein